MPSNAARRLQTERRAEAERKILLAATRLIGDRGLRGVSLRDVSHEAGYSRGIVNHHFGTKKDLIKSVTAPALQALPSQRLTRPGSICSCSPPNATSATCANGSPLGRHSSCCGRPLWRPSPRFEQSPSSATRGFATSSPNTHRRASSKGRLEPIQTQPQSDRVAKKAQLDCGDFRTRVRLWRPVRMPSGSGASTWGAVWRQARAVGLCCRFPLLLAASALVMTSCGECHAVRGDDGGSVLLARTPRRALDMCREMRIMRPVCPTRVPAVVGAVTAPQIGAECSENFTGTVVPLGSARCRDGEWSYAAAGRLPPGVPTGKTVLWNEPPGPPWFVHVDIIATRDSRPCLWPDEHKVRVLSDRLIAEPHHSAIELGDVRWAGRTGELFLTPPYPSGGEIGGHLAFCYSAAGVNYAVTLHTWTQVFDFTANGVSGAVRLRAKPTAPAVITTLRSVLSSAQ